MQGFLPGSAARMPGQVGRAQGGWNWRGRVLERRELHREKELWKPERDPESSLHSEQQHARGAGPQNRQEPPLGTLPPSHGAAKHTNWPEWMPRGHSTLRRRSERPHVSCRAKLSQE